MDNIVHVKCVQYGLSLNGHYMIVGIVLGQFDWLLLLQLDTVITFLS